MTQGAAFVPFQGFFQVEHNLAKSWFLHLITWLWKVNSSDLHSSLLVPINHFICNRVVWRWRYIKIIWLHILWRLIIMSVVSAQAQCFYSCLLLHRGFAPNCLYLNSDFAVNVALKVISVAWIITSVTISQSTEIYIRTTLVGFVRLA